MSFAALIVAAGRGTRAGAGSPKQYRMLAGQPVLRRTLYAFLTHPRLTQACVVIHPDDRDQYDNALDGIDDARLLTPATGGATRAASVREGLEALASRTEDKHVPELVLVHDAARPFVTHAVIDGVLDALDTVPGAVPTLPVVDALWHGVNGSADKLRPRDGLWRAQTPQGFHFPALLSAHRQVHDETAADDAALARAAGLRVSLTRGCEDNVKLTRSDDFERAESRMNAGSDVRTGNGYDVHRLGDGPDGKTGVILCGITLPHPQILLGHSDADVAMHAITDAIFGALSEGDIGQWFPPSEARWKGADSRVFLEKAVERVTARGGRVTHVDCTIICQEPKIGPHAEAMRRNIAGILGITQDRVSVKATTTERLGFPGRGEGIAAQATATVILG